MSGKIYVWDKLVRSFHWALVAFFLISYLTGDELETVHVYSGYAILVLLVIRIVWGVIGSKYARFTNFVRPFPEAVSYVRGLFNGTSEHYTGHNPAGGLMIIALILSLGMTGYSGLKLYGAEGHGPLAVASTGSSEKATSADEYHRDNDHDDDDDRHEAAHHEDEYEEDEEAEEFWEEIHEFFANFTVLLVLIHIAGVFASGIYHNENLVKAMIDGFKKDT